MTKPTYSETLEVHGIKVPYLKDVISERMVRTFDRGRYAGGQIKALKTILRPNDKVLELGAGVGVVSTVAAHITGAENVVAVEANPQLIPIIHETQALNGVEGIEVLTGVGVGTITEERVPFYLRKDFWASSLIVPAADDSNLLRTEQVPQIDINQLLKAYQPNVLVLDIEGGELDLLPALDLSCCSHLVIELHPRAYQLGGIGKCFDILRKKGFAYNARQSRGGTVVVFTRMPDEKSDRPRVTAISCMKDEGPFILEWVAYHQSIGITDFLIFTNDCSDGTVEILDRLDALGHVRHLPNPSKSITSPRHQPVAIKYAVDHSVFRNADWIISMDVDEFINIHVGDRSLAALFRENQSANIISMCHLDFGCSGIEHYEDRLITEQMTVCDEKYPEEPTRRGIKTLIRSTAPPYTISNHRPFFENPNDPQLKWVDGAGRQFGKHRQQGKHKGMPCNGAYEQVQLNHYPVRSMEAYLTKAIKGSGVAKDSFHGIEYWTKRNANNEMDDTIQPLLKQTKIALGELLSDPILSDLHQKTVAYHKAKIKELRSDKKNAELLKAMKKAHFQATKQPQKAEVVGD